jgi:hypothetical protein
MEKFRPFLYRLPEYYFIILVLAAGYQPPFSIHPVSVLIALLLLIQIRWKKIALGIVLGSLFFLVNIFFFGAILSEFKEFSTFDGSAVQLLGGGSLFIALNFLFSIWMLKKYGKELVYGSQSRKTAEF